MPGKKSDQMQKNVNVISCIGASATFLVRDVKGGDLNSPEFANFKKVDIFFFLMHKLISGPLRVRWAASCEFEFVKFL